MKAALVTEEQIKAIVVTRNTNPFCQMCMATKQEPVAWIRSGDDQLSLVKVEDDGYMVWKPLYTAPPSKPWVSLTDDEIWEWFESNTAITRDGALRIARAIEVKLREKNT